jgi:alpha-beta hydrolase superfamily lysophospholipase
VLAALALAALILWLTSSAVVAWKFTRRGSGPFPEPPPKVAWAAIAGRRLETSDGQQLGAWFVRGDRDKACFLLLHGISASRLDMLSLMQMLAERRYNVLAVTLRAHGDSSGETNDFGWSARLDVVAAVGFLRQECPGRPVFIVGRSMGAAAAVFAAKELDTTVAGYFLEEPYKDLRSAVWNRLHRRLPPVLDWAAYTGLCLWAPAFLPVGVGEVSPYDRVGDIRESVPIVLAAGSVDRHAPLADVTALFNRVRSHAKLVVFERAGHEALDRNDPQLYRTILFQLLERPQNAAAGR